MGIFSRYFYIFTKDKITIKGNRVKILTYAFVILLLLVYLLKASQTSHISTYVIVFFSAVVIFLGLYKNNAKNVFNKPLVHIGDLSYSLYLWHFPVIIFYNKLHLTITGHGANDVDYIIILAIIYGVSYLSYNFIENPFRKIKLNSIVKKYSFLIIIVCLMIGLSSVMYIPYHKIMAHFQQSKYNLSAMPNIYNYNYHYHNFGGAHTAIFTGDSHATRKVVGTRNWAKRNNFNIYIVSQAGCFDISEGKQWCQKVKDYIQTAFIKSKIDTIIINNRYTKDLKKNIDYFISLNPKLEIIIIGDQPELTIPVYECVRDYTLLSKISFLNNLFKKHICLVLNHKKQKKSDKKVTELYTQYKDAGINVKLFLLTPYFKSPYYGNKILFKENHLNNFGAIYLYKHTDFFNFKSDYSPK